MKKLLTFPKGGVHPPEAKELTRDIPIEDMPTPKEVEIPLIQHFGAPCKPTVKSKDRVCEGDIIGVMETGLGANIHASVTGTVKSIGTSVHPVSVSCPSIAIETDLTAALRQYSPIAWREFSREQLLENVKNAGIVGLGGAGFPTHIKLSPPPHAKVDTLILNGAECEPYLTGDHRVMVAYPKELIEAAQIILSILGIEQCYVGIEANKPDAIEAMEKAARDMACDKFRIAVKALKVKYPQGAERQLIYSILSRRVPSLGLPFDVGVVVQNVGTAKAIYDAVVSGKPLYEKVITVSGRGIQRPANLRVKMGTRVKDIVEFLGGTKPNLRKVVMGGPMMGFAISTLDIPVTKTTSGVLFLTEDEIDSRPPGQCIRCGRCLDVCPMGLCPNVVSMYVQAGRGEDAGRFGISDCFECGSCAFVCPAKRPLVQFVRLAKIKAKNELAAKKGFSPSC